MIKIINFIEAILLLHAFAFCISKFSKKEVNHNEIVGYVPKIQAVIAKEKSIDKVPDDVLEFAHENNLPVVLI